MRKVSSDPDLQLAEAVTAVMEGCWRIGVAICLQSTWRWRVNYFDDLNNITEGHHTAMLHLKLRHGYRTVHLHLKKNFPAGIGDLAAEIVQRALYDGPARGNLHLPVHYRRR
ncbi:hypothetical protein PF011_g29797 [Phytophthora fragariae]|uniref:RNase H type-1 domain-containing protein n=1 Tax=Phytophthora fragariae TaxID=53985 RepID=A0A6A3GWN0_9STRA|nr:hypothetical protein PF011_g29797 [Phytophthora fragariae]